MAKFSEYKSLDLIDVAENVAAYWKNNDTFKKSVEIREGHPEFVIFGVVVFPEELYAFILFEFGVGFEEFYASLLEDIVDFFEDNGGDALPLIVGVYPDEVEIRPIVFPPCLQEMPPPEREELTVCFL